MKKIMVALLIAFVAIAAKAQSVKVSVSGTAPADATAVYLYADMDQKDLVDSAIVAKGKWNWRGERPEGSILMAAADGSHFVVFFADGTDVQADLATNTVLGSPQSRAANDGWQRFLMVMLDAMSGRLPQGTDPKMAAFEVLRDVVMANTDNMVPTLFVPIIGGALSYGDLKKLLDNPSAPYAADPSMKQARQLLMRLEESMKKRPIGSKFTDMTLTDADDREHKLSEWCGRGNYVLIDFWASWCGPCLSEMPNVIANYGKYHPKGFNVIGLSFDSTKENWTACVERLGMAWPQLSDLKGWQGSASDVYGIRSIPANILLDGDGIIIDVDLRGSMLSKRLAEIYGF